MALPYDQLNNVARRIIVPGITDLNYKNDPFLQKLRARTYTYPGGVGWQETILYASQPGGFYKKGGKLSTEQRQTLSALEFKPRYADVPVALYLEDIEVENAGPEAVIKLADTKLSEAALTMSARLAIAQFHDGQSVGSSDRTEYINGLAEAVNDGVTNSWTGRTYTKYGGLTRTDVNGRLDSLMTDPASNVDGPISYDILEFSYNLTCRGTEHPDIGVTSNRGMSLIKSVFQPYQRVEGQDPAVSFTGLKFNSAVIFQSNYCPGKDGVDDADLGNYKNAGGEVFFWINTGFWKFVLVASDLFSFGFSGFIPNQVDGNLVGHYKFGGNLVCLAPWANYQLYNIKAA